MRIYWRASLMEAAVVIPAPIAYIIMSLKEKISPYLYTAVWHDGKQFKITDALSWAPVSHHTPDNKSSRADSEPCLRAIVNVKTIVSEEVSPLQNADRTLQEHWDATWANPSYIHLQNCIISGLLLNCYDAYSYLLHFWKLWDNLYTDISGLVVRLGYTIYIHPTPGSTQAFKCHTMQTAHPSGRTPSSNAQFTHICRVRSCTVYFTLCNLKPNRIKNLQSSFIHCVPVDDLGTIYCALQWVTSSVMSELLPPHGDYVYGCTEGALQCSVVVTEPSDY